jgi:hypothetical protein
MSVMKCRTARSAAGANFVGKSKTTATVGELPMKIGSRLSVHASNYFKANGDIVEPIMAGSPS